MMPLNDKIKVKVETDEYGFGGEAAGVEKGIIVEVPKTMLYLGFHSFSFENSIASQDILGKTLDFYKELKGKLIFWESLQDRGRRFKEGDEEFVFLNMTDIIAYSNDVGIDVTAVNQTGSAGSFNLS